MKSRILTEHPALEPFNFNQFAELTRSELLKLGKEPHPIIRALYQEYKSNQTYYDNVFKNPRLANQLQSALKGIFSSIDDMVINTQFVLLGVLASMVTPISAQQASTFFKSHMGTPPGGKNLCDGALYEAECAQGYTTQGDTLFQPGIDSQFVRSIKQVGEEMNRVAFKQLQTCFTSEIMGTNVTNVRNQPNASATLQSCASSSLPWYGYSIDSTVTNVPTDQCAILKDEIDASIQACKNTAALMKAGEIAGIAIGSSVGLCLIIGSAYLIYKKCCKVNDKNHANGRDIEAQIFNLRHGR